MASREQAAGRIEVIDATRNAELACIHVAKKQLGLDEVTYRDIVYRVSAKFRRDAVESAGLMTERERRALIDELRGFGFKKPIATKPRNPGAGQVSKIRAMWQALNEAGALRNPTERGLRAFIKRQTGGVEMPQWLTAEQANKVIEGLKAMQKRTLTPGADAVPSPANAGEGNSVLKADIEADEVVREQEVEEVARDADRDEEGHAE